MDDQVLVGVLDRRADVEKQLQTPSQVQLGVVRILIHGLAVDILHDEVRASVLDLTGIQQLGDVLVIQAREDLPLGPQAHAEIGVHRCPVNDLDRDLGAVLAIGALAQIHRAGAAVPQDLRKAIVADDLAQKRLTAITGRDIEGRTQRMGERRSAAAIVHRQHAKHFFAELQIIQRPSDDKRRLFLLRKDRSFVEQRFHARERGIDRVGVRCEASAFVVVVL